MATIKFNKIYKPLFTTNARYIHIHGGRSRGGSHSATAYFLHLITQPEYFRGYFLREVFADIRGSLWQDFKDRVEECQDVDESEFHFNENSMTVVYLPTGNTISSKGFKKSSGKSTAKLKSIAGATHVLVEESDEVDELDFNQLDVSLRTTKSEKIQVIMVFNPPNKDHWIIKRWYNLIAFTPEEIAEDENLKEYYKYTPKGDPSLCSIYSTYKDNLKNVNETTVATLEKFKDTNPDYYYTMVRGYVSEGMRGVIFRNWKPISWSEYNALPYPEFYGLDFGYSEDPVAMPGIKHHNGKLYIREVIYKKELTNPQLIKEFEINNISRSSRITADSAEPKSIAELQKAKYNVKPAKKGPDSVTYGIKKIKEMEVYYVETSTNLIYEKNNYKWALDSNKVPTDSPEDKNNHLMDGIRYGIEEIIGNKFFVV